MILKRVFLLLIITPLFLCNGLSVISDNLTEPPVSAVTSHNLGLWNSLAANLQVENTVGTTTANPFDRLGLEFYKLEPSVEFNGVNVISTQEDNYAIYAFSAIPSNSLRTGSLSDCGDSQTSYSLKSNSNRVFLVTNNSEQEINSSFFGLLNNSLLPPSSAVTVFNLRLEANAVYDKDVARVSCRTVCDKDGSCETIRSISHTRSVETLSKSVLSNQLSYRVETPHFRSIMLSPMGNTTGTLKPLLWFYKLSNETYQKYEVKRDNVTVTSVSPWNFTLLNDDKGIQYIRNGGYWTNEFMRNDTINQPFSNENFEYTYTMKTDIPIYSGKQGFEMITYNLFNRSSSMEKDITMKQVPSVRVSLQRKLGVNHSVDVKVVVLGEDDKPVAGMPVSIVSSGNSLRLISDSNGMINTNLRYSEYGIFDVKVESDSTGNFTSAVGFETFRDPAPPDTTKVEKALNDNSSVVFIVILILGFAMMGQMKR